MIQRVFYLLLAVTVCHSTVVCAEDGPASDVPELQALSNYIGTWDVAVTSKDSPLQRGRLRQHGSLEAGSCSRLVC